MKGAANMLRRTRPGSPGRRQAWLGLGMCALMVVFGVRLATVQVIDGPAIANAALLSRVKTVTEPAPRGDIIDAGGAVLATSVKRYLVVVDQRQVPGWIAYDENNNELGRGVKYAAEKASQILGIEQSDAFERLNGERGYVKLAEDATPDQWRQLRQVGIAGVTATSFYKRIYPAGRLAGNILGYGFQSADEDKPTQWTGVEGGMDKILTGTEGKQEVEQGLGGQAIPGGLEKGTAARPGRDVQLTIDWDLQYYTQQAIEAQVRKTGAQWGTVIVIQPKTGEVLALADSGSLDPNKVAATPAGQRGSRAVETTFEPGSTSKVISMAMALEEGAANPTTKFQVPYTYTTSNGQAFKDSHEHAVSNWTLTGILAQSSNVGTIMATQNIPNQVRYDYLAKFGLGRQTGIELPSETAGTLHAAKDWDGRTQYAVMFGQGLSVNALQATGVFATIANGGLSKPLHLVKAVANEDGELIPVEGRKGKRVVSKQTAAEVMTMLESAVDDGTGAAAAIPGYRVVGKTGTSQMADSRGKLTKYASSFIGVVPAEDPQFVIGVVLFQPKSSIYGGVVSAPVFKQVGGFALQQLSVPPSTTGPKLYPTTW